MLLEAGLVRVADPAELALESSTGVIVVDLGLCSHCRLARQLNCFLNLFVQRLSLSKLFTSLFSIPLISMLLIRVLRGEYHYFRLLNAAAVVFGLLFSLQRL